jgi:hypothetical protein
MPFNYLDEDDKSYQLQTPDGNPVTVAKSAISPEMDQIIQSVKANQVASRSPASDGTDMDLPQAANEAPEPSITPTAAPPATPGTIDPKLLALPPIPQTPVKQGPDRIAGINSGFGMMMQGTKEAAQAGADAATAISSFTKQQADEMQKRQLELQERKQAEDEQVGQQMTELTKAQDDAQKAAQVDPNRFWNNLGTGDKILAGLSIGLGSIGGAMTGKGGNVALDIINNAIQRDFEAQKLEADQKRHVVSDKMNLVQLMRSRFSDRAQADAAAQAAMYQQAEMQLKGIQSQYQAPEIQARAKQMLGEIQIKRNEAMAGFEQSARQQAALQALSKGGAGQATGADLMNLPKEARETYVQGPGFSGFAYTNEGAKSVRDSVGTVGQATSSIDRLMEIAKSDGRQYLPNEVKAEAQTLTATLKGALRKEIVGPGAVSETEWKLLNDVVADPTKINQLSTNTLKRLETLKETLVNGVHQKAKAEGIKIPDVGFKAR